MVVPVSVDHEKISVPLGSVVPLLFIFSPIGTVPLGTLLFLMPIYRLENAPAVPVQVYVAPPLSFSDPAVGVVQLHPPPGEYVGPFVMTIAPAVDAATSRPSTARIATLATAEPQRLPRAGVTVPGTARVCAAE